MTLPACLRSTCISEIPSPVEHGQSIRHHRQGRDLPARPNWSIHYRPMTLADIPQVHAIDQLSFSLPWPERSYQL